MFFVRYVVAELSRRRGRTILTALGLAVGVGLVITVNALSTGLDNAQARVLKPLTGVGTDMTVTRPITFTSNGTGGFGSLSPSQRKVLRKEAGGPGGLNFRSLKPGATVNTDSFTPSGNLSFSSSRVTQVSRLSGVAEAAGSLTLTDLHITGTVPKFSQSFGGGGGFQGGGGGNGGGGFNNGSLKFSSRTVTGIDPAHPELAAVTPSQIIRGRYFSASATGYEAILSAGYADANKLGVGSKITLGGKTFTVIGIASAPLGGTATDTYVKLATLQALSDLKGQVNGMSVQAQTGADVSSVSSEITSTFSGATVTTAADLARRIGGSLTDTRNLSRKLGTALEIVGLVAAVLIASLLALSSVAKRVREIGTLKALGWSRFQVVRQICAESLGQGLIGGAIGVAVGVVAVLVINAVGWTLKATVPAASTGPRSGGRGGFFGGGGPFGAGSTITSGSSIVPIHASMSATLVLAAVALAVLGGLVAGAVGGLRAARMRPADALRTVE